MTGLGRRGAAAIISTLLLPPLAATAGAQGQPSGGPPARLPPAINEEGQKNIGSGAALVFECSHKGHLDRGFFAEYITSLRRTLDFRTWDGINGHYHAALDARRMYVPATGTWVPFEEMITPEGCRAARAAAEEVMAALGGQLPPAPEPGDAAAP